MAPFNPHYPASSYNQLATNEPVFLQSANFPARVPPGSECSWHISAPRTNQVLRIEFQIFKMAKNCQFHYVALYSSDSCNQEDLTKANEIAVLCGTKRRREKWVYFSKSGGLCVVMVTDKSSVSAGFKASYEAISIDHAPSPEQRSRSKNTELVDRHEIPQSIGRPYWVIGA